MNMKQEVCEKQMLAPDRHLDFKHELVKDILYQIDYQAALRISVVEIPENVMIKELEKLPIRVLLAWYSSYLFFRREMLFSGYELHGKKLLDLPFDAIRKKMNNDPDFDIDQYIL